MNRLLNRFCLSNNFRLRLVPFKANVTTKFGPTPTAAPKFTQSICCLFKGGEDLEFLVFLPCGFLGTLTKRQDLVKGGWSYFGGVCALKGFRPEVKFTFNLVQAV